MKKYNNELNSDIFVDHIDRNGLNNTKKNLRLVNRMQSSLNARKRNGTYSKYKGVTRNKNKWQSVYRGKYLGLFLTEDDAFKAYKKASIGDREFIFYGDNEL